LNYMKPSEAVEKLGTYLASLDFTKDQTRATVEYQVAIMRFLFDHDLTIKSPEELGGRIS
jgi:hypothetical protein